MKTVKEIRQDIRREFPEVEFIANVGYCGPDWHHAQAAYYGNLARVAAHFYVETGNEAELTAAYFYTRYAVRALATDTQVAR